MTLCADSDFTVNLPSHWIVAPGVRPARSSAASGSRAISRAAIPERHDPAAAKGAALSDTPFPEAEMEMLDRLQLGAVAGATDHGEAAGQQP